MPRTARNKSGSEIYHVMFRGINKQNIFEDAEDYNKFLQSLKYCKEKSEIEIYAYCLMPNHIHLLIKEGNEPLAITFRRLGSKFVYWYNTKYERVGHLFQDRFKSEAVEDDEYFITVLRYIHLNPVKANLVNKPEAYEYSSYNSYIKQDDFVDSEKVLSLIPEKQFVKFHKENCNDNLLDISNGRQIKVTDEAAERIMHNLTNCSSNSEFKLLQIEEKIRLIGELKSNRLSIRQISRLTDETYYFIQKI